MHDRVEPLTQRADCSSLFPSHSDIFLEIW